MNAPLSPTLILTAIEAERLRRSCERSLFSFVQAAWHVIEPGVPFVDSWHLRVICEHLEAVTRGDITRLLINIPPRHSKSTIIVMWTVWEWIEFPQQKYLCASYSGALSLRDNLKARRLIESPWYQSRWGDSFSLTSDQNQKGRFENSSAGYRISTSVNGVATGEGGSRLILDDPHSALEAQSDVLRASTIEWLGTVWASRLNTPKIDAMVTIMQRLHEDDASGYYLGLGGWEHLCIPAEYDGVRRTTILGEYDPRTKKGELICEDRFGRKEIDALKRSLGSYGTAGQLQQNPVPAEGGILRTTFIRKWPANARLPQLEYVIQSYDGAYTERTTGDPTACTVWAIFSHGKQRHILLVDAWDDHLAYPKLRKKVVEDWTAEYGGGGKGAGMPTRAVRASRVLIENKASGISLLQDLRLANVPVTSYNPGNADKVSRAHQSAAYLEAGLVWVMESTKQPGEFVDWALPFVEQLKRFPVAKNDDYVDTFTQTVIYCRDEGWLELPTAKELYDTPPPKERVNPYGA